MAQQRHVNYTLKPVTKEAAKPAAKAYSLTDGGGLILEVLPGGSRVWLEASLISCASQK